LNKSSINLLTAICVAGMLAGCSQADNKTATTTTTGDSANAAAKKDPQVTTTVAPNGQKQIKISLESLPNDMVICTVSGKNITIGDYRRMLKLQQVQAQQNISANPDLRNNLFNEATKRGVTLTAEEKAKLIETAKAQHKDFTAFLKEKNLTEEQFNKEVEQAGIVFKMSNAAIEEGLLTQVVSRALLASASNDAASVQQADASYQKVKAQTNNFENLKKTTGLTDDEIKTETVNAELARMQLAKIEKTIKISDKEIQDFYKKNQSQLKHNERIRLSRIVVSAPDATQGPWMSVTDQVKKANPKLEGADLDKMVSNVVQQQQQKALVLLGEAKATSDFGKLANSNTDEPITRALKNGGDMGWQEKTQLVPQFADAVWTIKSGTILPKLVKTNEGFSIIKVTAHEGTGTLSLADVKQAIEIKLKQEKMNKQLNAWINDRQKVTKIEFSPKFVKIANGGQTPKVQ
jgi:parvulin-like peptidyl-prolyl isomerase